MRQGKGQAGKTCAPMVVDAGLPSPRQQSTCERGLARAVQRINRLIIRNSRRRSRQPVFRSVPATHPMRHVLMSQPVMHHAFAIVFAPIGSRFVNRQHEQHEQTYSESDQTRDRFSVHGSLL
jgi:hypothetical protein